MSGAYAFAALMLLVGCALTLAGYFGPADNGTLEGSGLLLIVVSILWAVTKT